MEKIPIERLNLSRRAINVLHRIDICDVEQLLHTPIEYIAVQKNIGAKTIAEIETIVKKIKEKDIVLDNSETVTTDFECDNMPQASFSEEQLEELSYHFTTELELSNRAMNTLMKIECMSMDALAKMSEADIDGLKGVGAKTCCEILDKRNQWLEANGFSPNSDMQNEEISKKEQIFYRELAKKIKPIVNIYWKELRSIALKNESLANSDFEFTDDESIRQVLNFKELEEHIRSLFLKYVPNGIVRTDELDKRLSLPNLEFDNAILLDKISDGTICTIKGEYCFLNRPHVMQYVKEDYEKCGERNREIILKRLYGANLQMIGNEYRLTRERVRQC